MLFTLACAKLGHGTLQPPMHDAKDQAMPEIFHSVWPMDGCSALDTHSVFFISLSLTFDWLGAAGNTNTTHLQLRTSSGFCPSNIRLPTNQNEPTKSREIQSFADRRITRDMPHAVLHAWGRQARPRRTKHQRCCPPKLKPQSARKSKQ